MSDHVKRLAAPRVWPIVRKKYTFAPKISPGPHPAERAVPMLIVLRDMLKLANNRREAKKILNSRKIKVDGRVVTDIKFPIGFMDVITIDDMDKNYRAVYDIYGNLRIVEIPKDNAEWKLVRIEDKHIVPGGKIQLNLHDGRNILLDENKYHTKDVLKIKVPTQEIIAHYPMAEGSVAIIIGGKHRGRVAHIKEYVVVRGPQDNMVKFEEGFEVNSRNVFVIGVGKPEITIPEVSAL
ncbi:ribosomal protein S4E [Aciduliprofundum sp. MAR08-339]|uniref:30S ribosomal protein S4e n=1 Tax=Aciduliprofundum sp. (strain MAR08-339) TaxID=673860 RepID=UPI0002A47EFE|nr:ribosomal protein S4E [Aciduliprofundum sp. MAR08-339]